VPLHEQQVAAVASALGACQKWLKPVSYSVARRLERGDVAAQLRALLVRLEHRSRPAFHRFSERMRCSIGQVAGSGGSLSTAIVLTYGVFAVNGTGTACLRAASCS
jgi:hypothetical protein